MAETIKIGGELESTATGNVVAAASAIKDKVKNKYQGEINAETDATLAEHGTAIRALNSQNYVTVPDYASLPQSGQSTDTVYRVSNYDGALSAVDSTKYSEYAWDGTQYLLLSVKSAIEEVFDVSEYNASGGSYATYTDLADLLTNHLADIPVARRKGGMSIKFVQSSDNKYVQARLMAQSFTTDVTQWQGVDDEPTPGSENLVKSGGVYTEINSIKNKLLVSFALNPSDLKSGYINTGTVGSQIAESAQTGRWTTHGGVQVSAGDIVRFKYSASNTAYFLCLTDSNDIILYRYKGNQYAGKDVRLVIPTGVSKLYLTTNSLDGFYLIKQIRFYDELEVNTINGFLKPVEYTKESGSINSSTGADATSASNNRCKIPIPSNAKYIAYQSSANALGCGFIVNGNWIGWDSQNKESNILIPIPAGATEFRTCWLTADYADGISIKMAVFTPSEGGGGGSSQVESMLTTYPVKLDLRYGGIGSSGEDVEATAFTRAEFDCDNMVQITLLKTVGGTSSYSYVFKVGDTWGTPVKFANNTPVVGTIDVPEGATKCKVAWNRNVSTVSDWWITAKGYLNGDEIEDQVNAACNDMAYQFVPDFDLTGINMTDELPLNWDDHQLSTIYDLFDALVTDYPDYVAKVDADSAFIAATGETLPGWMDGLHTYMYHFSPTRAKSINHGADKGSRIRVMLTDIHTNELMGLFSMARMMKHICDNWKTDKNAEQCRSLIDFYVFPITCPWAYTNGSRVNYNGVNINRNFPTHYWESSGSGTSSYSGVTAGDQYETKLMMYYTNLIKPHFLMDCHTTNVNNVGNLGLILTADGNQQYIDLAGVVARTISNDAIKNNTNFPDNPDYSLYDVYNEPNNSGYFGMYYMWVAQQGYGAAILTEEAAYSKWSNGVLADNNVEEHSPKLYGLQTRFLFNCVLRYVYAMCQRFYALKDKF